VAILGVVAILAFAAGPVTANGDGHQPFKGTAVGYGMVVPDPACPAFGLRSVFTATGYAAHMGAISMDNHHCTPPGHGSTEEMTIIAANGDRCITYGRAPVVGRIHAVRGAGRFVSWAARVASEPAVEGMTVAISWPGFEPNYWPTTGPSQARCVLTRLDPRSAGARSSSAVSPADPGAA
jgi:hypothetical protein